jgi:S-adenosylhomocysteine hydrolase
MSTGDFRVADISLADFGRKEIELAEHEVRMHRGGKVFVAKL